MNAYQFKVIAGRERKPHHKHDGYEQIVIFLSEPRYIADIQADSRLAAWRKFITQHEMRGIRRVCYVEVEVIESEAQS